MSSVFAMNYFATLILLIVGAILYFLWKFMSCYNFLKKNNIPFVTPYNLIFGHLYDAFFLRKSVLEIYTELYHGLEPHKFGGVTVLQKPTILIRDPELIKSILVKDFHHFQNRGINIHEEMEPLSNNLFNMKGEIWKNLRAKMTNTFTSGKMKMMFPLMKDCGDKFWSVLRQRSSNESIDAKNIVARFNIDIISSCAFGLEINSLENPDSEIIQITKKMLENGIGSVLRGLWPGMPPSVMKAFNLRMLNKEMEIYFLDFVRHTINHRETNSIDRKDFLNLMICLKNPIDGEMNEEVDSRKKKLNNYDLTADLIAAQAFLFFVAGFEPTSTVLSLLMMELALNENIQDKTRNEIQKMLDQNGGEPTYDSLKNLTYTEMVIDEALRKYTPAGLLLRQCNHAYRIPNTDVIIPNKTDVVIPACGLHRDSKYYEKPDEFYPEHFTNEAKAKRPHYTFLPFGEGPRICIAERFARMEIKMGLIYMLRGFRYQISPEMKFPLVYKKNFGILQVDGEILLKCQKI